MADDDFEFEFEGTLQKEAETYQGASVRELALEKDEKEAEIVASATRSMSFFFKCSLCFLSSLTTFSRFQTKHKQTTGRPRWSRAARSTGNAARPVADKLQEELSTGLSFFFGRRFFVPSFRRPLAFFILTLPKTKKKKSQTVCTYWLKGLCMKGDSCGFLHMFDSERMVRKEREFFCFLYF